MEAEDRGRVDAYASHRHLVDHLLPVWFALPESVRGRFHVAQRRHEAYGQARGVDARWSVPQMPGPLTLVASHPDYTQVHEKRPVAYLEHGAGMVYADHDWHPSYSGGIGRDRVAVFLTLNETTAAREQARYPDAQVVVVGSPRVDVLAARPREPRTSTPVVAFAWHWNARIVPETRETWSYWRHALLALRAEGIEVLGHGHPRILAAITPWYERHGIEVVADLAEVCARADLVAFDNTSAGYEAAAVGVPVLALNHPTLYRRDVHHGLRFWEHVPGLQCHDAVMLPAAVALALSDPPEAQALRAAAVAAVYPDWTRGKAASLAADAVIQHLAAVAA